MAKVNIKYEKITPFGGIYYASKAFYALSLDIGIFRADCGSYSEDIIKTVDGNCRIFYIRAIHCASMYSRIQDIREWRRDCSATDKGKGQYT